MNGSHSPLAVDVADAHEFTALMRFRAGLWQPGRRTS